ncbi:MAG TPA: DnaJ domain-containing protein [Patescibacteria group bacterium]|nr:DnaJ domain-containing protein [Patescibacteria group bacterium]
MTNRDPHGVLGVEPGASPTMIKAAWRRLARTHHPDLTGDDPEASRLATQRMAEINDAYAALTRDGGRLGKRWAGAAAGTEDGVPSAPGATGARTGGPPRPKPTRPVTARVDTSHTVRPRNQPFPTASGSDAEPILRGQSPFREYVPREPPRASTPTGPMARSVARDFRQPPAPALADALEQELEFGKFHGHTLGQVAGFEPSYIDWLATTITRDRDLVAAARVVRDDLDRRGIQRRTRPTGPPGTPAGTGTSV